MPFRPPGPRREHILAYGPAGGGKTRMYLSIAKKSEQLKSPGTFHVVNTDGTLPSMLGGENFELLAPRTQWMEWQQFPNGTGNYVPREEVESPRLVVYEPYEWPEYVEALKAIKAVALNDDWTIVDLMSSAWESVQDYYIDLVFRKDAVDFYLEARNSSKKGNPLDGDKDWSNINRMYREFAKMIVRARGHVFLTAGVKQVEMEGQRADKKEVRVTYGNYGVKPSGQKDTDHIVDTVILAQEFRQGEWTWTTVKDRERPKMIGATAGDFAMDYLVKTGGWKLA